MRVLQRQFYYTLFFFSVNVFPKNIFRFFVDKPMNQLHLQEAIVEKKALTTLIVQNQ